MDVSNLLSQRAALPEWFLIKARSPKQKEMAPSHNPRQADIGAHPYFEYILQKACDELRSLSDTKGQRNTSLNKAVFKVATLFHLTDMSKNSVCVAFKAAISHWTTCFSEQRFEGTFESAWKAGIEKPFTPESFKYSESKLSVITGTELKNKKIPPIRWIIPGLLTDGLTLLGGKPKAGKSWLALQTAIAIAQGGMVLGKPVTKGKALYAALEDSDRRLKGRLEILLGADYQLDDLFITRNVSRLDKGGLDELRNFADTHPDVRTMIIDTFARVKPPSKAGGNSYDHDSGVLAPLQQLAMEKGLAVILITHLRKQASGDVFDQITGTLGQNGIADSIWVLTRINNQDTGKLHITGRDVEEQELAVRFDKESCQWSSLGSAGLHFITEERRHIHEFLKNNENVCGPNEVYKAIGGSLDSIKHLMPKMVEDGLLVKVSRGKYTAFEGGEGLILPEC